MDLIGPDRQDPVERRSAVAADHVFVGDEVVSVRVLAEEDGGGVAARRPGGTVGMVGLRRLPPWVADLVVLDEPLARSVQAHGCPGAVARDDVVSERATPRSVDVERRAVAVLDQVILDDAAQVRPCRLRVDRGAFIDASRASGRARDPAEARHVRVLCAVSHGALPYRDAPARNTDGGAPGVEHHQIGGLVAPAADVVGRDAGTVEREARDMERIVFGRCGKLVGDHRVTAAEAPGRLIGHQDRFGRAHTAERVSGRERYRCVENVASCLHLHAVV